MAERAPEAVFDVDKGPPKRFWDAPRDPGFRHVTGGPNEQLHTLLAKLGRAYVAGKMDAIVCDDSSLTLEIATINSLNIPKGWLDRWLWNRRLDKAEGQAMSDMKPLGRFSSGISVIFDRLVYASPGNSTGEVQRFALAPAMEQEANVRKGLMDERRVCVRSLFGRHLIGDNRTDGWVPKLVIAAAFETTDVVEVAKVTEAQVNEIAGDNGIKVDFNPMALYHATTTR